MSDAQERSPPAAAGGSSAASQPSAAAAIAAPMHPHGPPAIYQIQQPSAYTVGYPPMYPFLPSHPQDANGQPVPVVAGGGDPNNPPAAHYMMAFHPAAPGMIYAYPAAQPMATPSGMQQLLPPALVRPKRKQVKMACTKCAAACKRCDESRPCQRCIKYNHPEKCEDGKRKERTKGIKRGPYKRKEKPSDEDYEDVPNEQVSQGFYQPYFYPPPGFVALGPDGQPMPIHQIPQFHQYPPVQAPGEIPQSSASQGGQTQGQAPAQGQPQYYHFQPYPPFAYPHGPPGPYAMFPGHMMPPSGTPGSVVVPPTNGTAQGSASTARSTITAPMTPPVSAAEETHPVNGQMSVQTKETTSKRGRKRKEKEKEVLASTDVNGKSDESEKDAPARKSGRSSQARVASPVRPTLDSVASSLSASNANTNPDHIGTNGHGGTSDST